MEERLRQIGSWLDINGEAVYGSHPWSHQNDTQTPGVWCVDPDYSDSLILCHGDICITLFNIFHRLPFLLFLYSFIRLFFSLFFSFLCLIHNSITAEFTKGMITNTLSSLLLLLLSCIIISCIFKYMFSTLYLLSLSLPLVGTPARETQYMPLCWSGRRRTFSPSAPSRTRHTPLLGCSATPAHHTLSMSM